MNVNILKAGYCTHIEKTVLNTGRFKTVQFPALFVLLKHPQEGYILFDTGYSNEFYSETEKFPFNLYAKITPVYFNSEESAVSQLYSLNINSEEVKYIILSHFHADHIGGVKSFPNAKFIVSRVGYEDVKSTKGIKAVMKGFIPNLLPNDFERRIKFIEEKEKIMNPIEKSDFTYGYDLFGDRKVIAIDLSGHTKGQYGIYVKGEKDNYFFIADSTWTDESYKNFILPSKLSNLIMYDKKLYIETLKKIHNLYLQDPTLKIIPSHSNLQRKD